MKRVLFLLLCFLLAAHVGAEPLIYNKTIIKIVSPTETLKVLDKKDDKKGGDAVLNLHRPPKEFAMEIRPINFLSQRDFIAHSPVDDKEGIMTVIDPPSPVKMRSISLIGKVDVLFVREDGLIERIMPEATLSRNMEPLESEKPLRAFIFFKSGAAQANDVRPGDRVDNTLFKTHPVVLQ